MSISMVLGLVAAILLFVQGVAVLGHRTRSPQDTRLSWLAILIALLGLITQIMLYADVLVITPQFGNVIVQGSPALAFLTVLMVAITVCAGMWLDVVRVHVGWREHQW